MKNELVTRVRSTVREALGSRPITHFSHRGALKLFESLGMRFEVRRFGEGRIGLLRWPIRKPSPGIAPRRLVFTPGFGDTPLSWWTVLAALKPVLKKRVDEVVLLDFPGFSGFLHDQTAFDSMDELLRCYRETLRSLQPRIVVGHSLGAWLAGDYAASLADSETSPGSLEELIVVDAGGVVGTEEERKEYRRIFTDALDGAPSEQLLKHAFSKAPLWTKLFHAEFCAFLKAPEIRAFVASFEDRHLLNERAGSIRAKTTVIWGDRDTLTPTAWLDRWLDALRTPEKLGVLIRGSGHSPQLEKPAVLIAVLTQVLLGRRPIDSRAVPFWKVVAPVTASTGTDAASA